MAFGSNGGLATATVRGTGSSWDATFGAGTRKWTIGGPGTGTGLLEVEQGATVRSAEVQIGGSGAAAGDGEASVTGLDSLWDISNALAVGYDGNGVLGVESGSIVRTVADVSIGARVLGRGDVDVLGDTSLLAVGTPTAGDLRVGVQGIGTLDIATGADAYSFGGTVGDRPFLDDFGDPIENGTVTITGAGSLWDVREILWVGRNGKGAIDVLDGGTLDVGNTLEIGGEDIGNITSTSDGGEGFVLVTGAGSRLVATNVLAGIDGLGVLDVADGASAELSGDLYIGGNDRDAGNTVHSDGLVTARGGAALDLRDLYVGNAHEGELRITEASSAESRDAEVGYQVDGLGKALVLVSGPDTTWMTRYLDVGEIGPGRVEVADGGRVEIVSAPGTPGRTIVGEFGELLVTGHVLAFPGRHRDGVRRPRRRSGRQHHEPDRLAHQRGPRVRRRSHLDLEPAAFQRDRRPRRRRRRPGGDRHTAQRRAGRRREPESGRHDLRTGGREPRHDQRQRRHARPAGAARRGRRRTRRARVAPAHAPAGLRAASSRGSSCPIGGHGTRAAARARPRSGTDLALWCCE